jgi:hypothetical protein
MASENPKAVANEWMNVVGSGSNVPAELFINVPNYYRVGISGEFCCYISHLYPGT